MKITSLDNYDDVFLMNLKNKLIVVLTSKYFALKNWKLTMISRKRSKFVTITARHTLN